MFLRANLTTYFQGQLWHVLVPHDSVSVGELWVTLCTGHWARGYTGHLDNTAANRLHSLRNIHHYSYLQHTGAANPALRQMDNWLTNHVGGA